MYRAASVQIRKGHRLYDYCSRACVASAKLYNRANYIVRQYATAVRDLEQYKPLRENQLNVYELVRKVTSETKYATNTKWLTFCQIDYILKAGRDESYYAMHAQANQQTLRLLMRDYTSFFESLKAYKTNPAAFTGRPKMPHYVKGGSLKTAVLTNQICRVKDGRHIKFPGTKIRLNAGTDITKLQEVRIKPRGDAFEVSIVYEIPDTGIQPVIDAKEMKAEVNKLSKMTDVTKKRIVAIDPGVDNFCSIVNNFGQQPMLIKGGSIKSANQFYNKELARLKSQTELCNRKKTSRRISRLHLKRDNIIKDRMHKISRYIADYCKEQNVDMVILGHNVYQKQEIAIGHVNNQSFVQIPYAVFAGMLSYKLAEKGIRLLLTEESYTSKADYLAKDTIPVYGVGDKEVSFSGKRIKRGLYRHFDGKLSNADINGAANILRKVFPKVTQWDRGVVDTPCAVRVA